MKSWAGLALVGVTFGLLSQSCGSSSPKKSTQNPTAGRNSGDAGESSAGEPGSSGNGGTGNSSNGGSAGVLAEAGDGGTSAAGAGPECPTGFGECDGDLSDLCEQDLSLVTSCGSCGTTCNSKNGTATCEEQKCVLACSDGFGDCDGNPNNGCEAALASNAENCGACGRDCAAVGATCMVNACSTIPMQTGAPYGNDGAGNRTWAMSPSGILHLGVFSYDVTRFPLDGSPAQNIWTASMKTSGNNSLLVVGNDVYWSEFGTGTVAFTAGVFKKKITDAGTVLKTTAFVPEWTVQFLRKSGNALYWATGDYQSGDPGGYIYTRALDAPDTDHGTKIVSADQGTHNGIFAMDVTSDAIYWVTQAAGTGKALELRTTPLAGGTPTAVPEVFAGTGTPVTVSIKPTLIAAGANLYFTRTINDAQDGIYRFKKGDTKPTLVVPGSSITSFVIDADYAYYMIQNQAGLLKAPLAGGTGVNILPGGYASRVVAQDDKFVYYVQSGCCMSSLFKVLK